MGKKRSSKTKEEKSTRKNGGDDGDLIAVDPALVRFQHSRIRPFFSGCGRSVMGTLDSIRNQEISPSDLPPIQVIVGPEDDKGRRWYFSLNNRRLWVLKRCREEGLLENNQIFVRVRKPKSRAEAARYSLENCAVEAKLMRETFSSKPKTLSAATTTSKDDCTNDSSSATRQACNTDPEDLNKACGRCERASAPKERGSGVEDDNSGDDFGSDSSDGVTALTNRFSLLF